MKKATRPTKAVIAAAGFGTRFLPQTKAMPKEMLPLIDKPIIQYVVEGLVKAGIRDIILVTGSNKRSIEDHFDEPASDLLGNLRAGGPKKQSFIDQIQEIAGLANFVYVRQKGGYGNAVPLLNVAHLIGDEPFIYTYADDIIDATPSHFEQMIDRYLEFDGAILPCVRATKDEDFERSGIVGGEPLRQGVVRATSILEKPGRAAAQSDLASIGGYLFTPEIFEYLERLRNSQDGAPEFQIQPIIKSMMDEGKPYFAYEIENAEYFDTGNKLEYLKTVVDFALRRDDLGPDFRVWLEGRICK
jgi:UTP--glucose-1-phosphate uridylyltransferase